MPHRKIPIEDVGLPERTARPLKAAGINTIGDIAQRRREDIERIEGIGAKSIFLIEGVLRKHNMSFHRNKIG
jgi:DNA-directed RNA polymerase alpha subunit